MTPGESEKQTRLKRIDEQLDALGWREVPEGKEVTEGRPRRRKQAQCAAERAADDGTRPCVRAADCGAIVARGPVEGSGPATATLSWRSNVVAEGLTSAGPDRRSSGGARTSNKRTARLPSAETHNLCSIKVRELRDLSSLVRACAQSANRLFGLFCLCYRPTGGNQRAWWARITD